MSRTVTHAKHGTVTMADDEVVLFFNNATIDWGWDALETGMTKEEALAALEERLFEPLLAEAFLKKMVQMVNIAFINGKLYKPGE
jgi:molybdopterin converting factor small subunit